MKPNVALTADQLSRPKLNTLEVKPLTLDASKMMMRSKVVKQ